MHARHGLTRAAVANVSRPLNAFADGMVEDEYPVGTGRLLDQPLSLRIVDASDFVFVVEILYRTVLPNQGKPLSVERYGIADRTNVMNGHAVRLGYDVRLGLAGWRLKGIGARPVERGRQIVEIGRYERQCRDLFVLQSHVLLRFVNCLPRFLKRFLERPQIQFVRPGGSVLAMKLP